MKQIFSFFISVSALIPAQHASAALPGGWHVAVTDFTVGANQRANKIGVTIYYPPKYYFEGSFELPNAGYSCEIMKKDTTILRVECKDDIGRGLSLYSPAPRYRDQVECSTRKAVDETAFSSVEISAKGKPAYRITIGAGSDYPCIVSSLEPNK